ncbi:MAG TPA: type 1 glutamine amidotransferase domain-containing protein [Kofleriaceae bacterium]|nr:type 1 glutamine amidotransferase domain-containing protein [Kofleriaceae bacterium]
MKNCLFVVTSVDRLDPGGPQMGLWLSNLTHPYFELMQVGFESDIASPRGGVTPIDPLSHPASEYNVSRDDIVTQGFLAAPHHVAPLLHTRPLADVDPMDYRAVVLCGGNGALFDLPSDPEIQRIVSAMWERGRVIAAISQGLAGLVGVTVNGSPLLAGYEVTGTCREERLMAEQFIGAPYFPFCLEREIPARTGARFCKLNAFSENVIVSGQGRLITAQNHFSGAALGRALGQALGRGSPPAARQPGPPQYPPREGLLSALNHYFHKDYESLVELTTLSLEHAGTPVIVAAGDELILRHRGLREVVRIIPPLYHQLKAIGHMVFGIHLSLEVRAPNGLNETELFEILQQQYLLKAVLHNLAEEGIPDEVSEVQAVLLSQASALLTEVLRTRAIDRATLREFARTAGTLMLDNNTRAQRAALDGVHAAVTAWLARMTEDVRAKLYVVVCGSHQARSQDIMLEYFQCLLGEQATTGAAREDRVLYAESTFGEEGALDLIARHIIDQDAGEAFFGDRMRMQRDLLSEGAADYIESLLTGSPYRRGA